MKPETINAFLSNATREDKKQITRLETEIEAWNNLMRDMLNSDEQPVIADFYLRAINLLTGESDETE